MGDYGKGKEQQKMYIKMNLPGKMGIRIIPSFYSMFLKKKNEVHYIGGSEVLPPPLDAIDEAHYIQGLVNGEEESLKEARSMLIEHNLRLVVYIAKKFDNTGVGVEDLISIGTIGLMKAIATYKEDYGSRLATYAARCIDNELLMYFRAKKKVSREVSLYEPIGMDKEGNQIHLLDIVESEEPDVVEMMERTRQIEKLLGLVPKVLQERELYIVVHRYGLFGNKAMTQREIASAVGISRSYVSRIEKKALDKLKKSFCE